MYGAKPGDASMDNPRCDVLITRGQKHAVFPQKLAVGTQLSKLVGWDRPTEVRLGWRRGPSWPPSLAGSSRAGGRWAAAITEVAWSLCPAEGP